MVLVGEELGLLVEVGLGVAEGLGFFAGGQRPQQAFWRYTIPFVLTVFTNLDSVAVEGGVHFFGQGVEVGQSHIAQALRRGQVLGEGITGGEAGFVVEGSFVAGVAEGVTEEEAGGGVAGGGGVLVEVEVCPFADDALTLYGEEDAHAPPFGWGEPGGVEDEAKGVGGGLGVGEGGKGEGVDIAAANHLIRHLTIIPRPGPTTPGCLV